MRPLFKLTALSSLLLLGACVTAPTGPRVMALPGNDKNFEQFRGDDAECRQFASYQVGGSTADQAAADSVVRSAAVGTVIGAVAGAAVGGHHGAGVGAGTGLIVGSVAGANAADRSAYGTQRSYDNAYVQCMYSKGHRVPVPGGYSGRASHAAPMAPPPGYPPPPPPGYAPPPPPGYAPPR